MTILPDTLETGLKVIFLEQPVETLRMHFLVKV